MVRISLLELQNLIIKVTAREYFMKKLLNFREKGLWHFNTLLTMASFPVSWRPRSHQPAVLAYSAGTSGSNMDLILKKVVVVCFDQSGNSLKDWLTDQCHQPQSFSSVGDSMLGSSVNQKHEEVNALATATQKGNKNWHKQHPDRKAWAGGSWERR